MNEQELYELETRLIKKYPNVLGKVRPRPISLIESKEYMGKAGLTHLVLNKKFIKIAPEREIINLLIHELVHYAFEGEGHSEEFLDSVQSMGYKTTPSFYLR